MLAKHSLIQLKTGCNPKESFKTLDSLIRKAADRGISFVSTCLLNTSPSPRDHSKSQNKS